MWPRRSTQALILDSSRYIFTYRIAEATFMAHVSFTDLRQNMASYFDRVTDDREPLLVTRQGGKGNVVILAEEEFAGWQETVHLLSSPKNAARLLASIRQLDSGQGRLHELFEDAGPDAG
jgi:antitoxin YefM